MMTEGVGERLFFFFFFSSNPLVYSVQEFMNFTGTTIAERTNPGQRQSVESESKFSDEYIRNGGSFVYTKKKKKKKDNVAHVYCHPQGVCGMIMSDKDYPSRVAFSLLNKIMDEFLVKFSPEVWKKAQTLDYPELATYVSKYQDPQQADTIMKVQKELDETTAILVNKYIFIYAHVFAYTVTISIKLLIRFFKEVKR
jgi:synaptobrevin family protein YKT6